MAALKNVRDTSEIANDGKTLSLPVKASTTIYQGALVALDANGYAIPGKKAAGLTAAGRAEETVVNSGADGDQTIRVTRGVFVFENTSTTANFAISLGCRVPNPGMTSHRLQPLYSGMKSTAASNISDSPSSGHASLWKIW